MKQFPQEILSQRFPDMTLIAKASAEWGALNDNHRLSLHQAVQDFREFSISHAPAAGGYVAVAANSSRVLPVGFDIEVSERVRSIVVKRVMNANDDVPMRVPSSLVWSAKEAAFKSLKGPGQPSVISDIVLSRWKPMTDGLWEFSFAPLTKKSGPVIHEPVGQGFVWAEGPLQYAVCLRTRQ